MDRACPLCGSADQSRVVAESNIDLQKLDRFAFASRKSPEHMHPRLIECVDCGLLYGSPVPSSETLAHAYQNADFDSATEAHCASSTYANQIRHIVPHLPDRNGALDIGAGDGAFLEQLLGLGFQNVVGIEPSEAPYAAAKTEIRKRLRLGLFRPTDFRPGEFALVTCFQTMEHVPDPLEIARGAYSLIETRWRLCDSCPQSKGAFGQNPWFQVPDLRHRTPAAIQPANCKTANARRRVSTRTSIGNVEPLSIALLDETSSIAA